MSGVLIGIDAGGTMTKAALFDLDGRELACARRPNTMVFPAPGHTERDPDRMWQAACSAIAAVLEQSGTDPAEVLAVAATGYGAGIYLVDGDLNPVRPGIVSTDSRAEALLAGWQAEGLADACGARVQQRLWPAQSGVLLAHLHRHEPGLLARTRAVLLCKDFLRARLCGDCSTDATDAGISGLIDVTTGTYARSVFEDLGIAAWIDRLPPIGRPDEIVGTVSAEAARLTGLRAGTPVVRGVVDVAAASLACAMDRPEIMTIVAGTFSINQTLHRQPRLSRLPFLQCPYPIDGYYLATEGAATSASNLEWFCRVVLDGEAARAAAAGETIYDICERLVRRGIDHDSNMLFLPFLFGGPGQAPASLLGMTAASGLDDVLCAIYQGIAFAHRLDVDLLLSGEDAARPQRVRLAGGGARSAVWSQLFADVLGLPVEVMDCGELGAQGAAICAAAAVGVAPDIASAVQRMTRPARQYLPDPAKAGRYAGRYQRFRRTVATLGALWSEKAGAAPEVAVG